MVQATLSERNDVIDRHLRMNLAALFARFASPNRLDIFDRQLAASLHTGAPISVRPGLHSLHGVGILLPPFLVGLYSLLFVLLVPFAGAIPSFLSKVRFGLLPLDVEIAVHLWGSSFSVASAQSITVLLAVLSALLFQRFLVSLSPLFVSVTYMLRMSLSPSRGSRDILGTLFFGKFFRHQRFQFFTPNNYTKSPCRTNPPESRPDARAPMGNQQAASQGMTL